MTLAVSRSLEVPSWRLGMQYGHLEVEMQGAAGFQGQAANEPGMGRAASFAQAL